MNTLLVLFIIIPVLVAILLLLNKLFAPHFEYVEKVSVYECGYSGIYGQTRSYFQIQFYNIAMLFLIFDLEILLLLPISVSIYHVGSYGFSIAIIFFLVLTVGLAVEIYTGVISLTSIDEN
jgi:NADH:ubiquinone oxidoreductase subunit 3 (subunit A)